MQSNRMISIQRRAKRRIVVLVIATTAFAGYGALTLFGQDEGYQQLPIEKLSKAPGVKAVGIRLVNSNASAQQVPASPAPQSLLPPPGMLPPPSAFPPPAFPGTNVSGGSGMDSMLPPPDMKQLPSIGGQVDGDAKPVLTSLPTPPRMSDIQSKPPTGKVVMKLNGIDGRAEAPVANERDARASTPAEAQASNATTSADTVDIRVIPSRPTGQPAKMAPFVFEASAKNSALSTEKTKVQVTTPAPTASNVSTITMPTSQPAPIRMSLADSTGTSESITVVAPKNRTPQLVKSKPTQLEHVVILAQSTGIESQNVTEEPEIYVPPVEVDASLVPHAIAEGARSGQSKAKEPRTFVTDAVADAFTSLAPPAMEINNPSASAGGRVKEKFAEPVVDQTRRKFDQRPAYQSPIATVELECLAATSMDLAGRLVAIAVQDENVCKVLPNERNVSLVGNQTGTTLVQIWTADLGEKPQVIRVNVSQQWGKVQAKSNEVKDIKQVIAQSFPRANVSIISKEDGGIEVRGTTESEESAVRILELVRKLYLVPVKDKLTVSN